MRNDKCEDCLAPGSAFIVIMIAVRAGFASGWHDESTSSQDSAPTEPQTFAIIEKKATDDAPDSATGRERQWSVLFSCVVVGMLNLTIGVTLSIPSNVILDLTSENSLIGDSPVHQLTIFQQSIFAVSYCVKFIAIVHSRK